MPGSVFGVFNPYGVVEFLHPVKSAAAVIKPNTMAINVFLFILNYSS